MEKTQIYFVMRRIAKRGGWAGDFVVVDVLSLRFSFSEKADVTSCTTYDVILIDNLVQ